MTVQNLIGNQPNQIPRNSDLGGLSVQNASRAYIKDGVISNVAINSSTFGTINKEDNYPTQLPSLRFDFAKSKVVDSRLQSHRNSIATYTDSRGYLATANIYTPRIQYDSGVCTGLLLETASVNYQTYSQNFEGWANLGITVNTKSTISPDGTLNAQKFVADSGTGAHRTASPSLITITDGESITISVYVKYIDRKYIRFGLWDSSVSTAAFYSIFDISNGTVNSSAVVGSGVLTSSSITSVGNGWYRLTVTGTIAGFTESRVYINMYDDSLNRTWAFDGTSVYIWGAQVERNASKASSYIPNTTTNGGYALVPYKQVIGGTYNAYDSMSSTSNLLNKQLGINSRTFIEDTGNTTHRVEFWNYTPYSEKEWYVSVYVSSNGRNKFRLSLSAPADETGLITADYDLSTISVTSSSASIVSSVTATIERVNTTNLYKLTIRGYPVDANTYQSTILPNTTNGDRVVRAILYSLNASGNLTYTGDGTSGFYFSDCYFRDWADANDVDASDTIGDSNYYTVSANTTCYTNNIYAPDGTESASYLYVANAQAVTSAYVVPKTLPRFAVNTPFFGYVYKTFYAKYGGVQYAYTDSVWFDLQNGTVTLPSNPYNEYRASITSVGNSWYKCVIVHKINNYITDTFGIGMATTNGTPAFTGNGGGIYIHGMRSFMTDYYPHGSTGLNLVQTYYPDSADNSAITYTPSRAQTTRRAADLLWMPTASSWYNSAEGTFVMDVSTGSTGFAISLFDSSTSTSPTLTNNLALGVSSGLPTLYENIYSGSSYTKQYGLKEVYTDSESRLAFGYKASDIAINANNGETLNILDVTSIPSTINQLNISNQWSPFNGTIKRITYYPFRVTDTELQELSKK